MATKHISKVIEEVKKDLPKKPNTKPKTKPVERKKSILKPFLKTHKSKYARKVEHPMAWFFVQEKAELARREKLKKQGKGLDGRPPVIDEIVIRKLEYAFALDCTVEEACAYACIGKSTYFDFIKKHPMFAERVDALRELPMDTMGTWL